MEENKGNFTRRHRYPTTVKDLSLRCKLVDSCQPGLPGDKSVEVFGDLRKRWRIKKATFSDRLTKVSDRCAVESGPLTIRRYCNLVSANDGLHVK
jgi:hypothetical protein